jgi:hypothetical protein
MLCLLGLVFNTPGKVPVVRIINADGTVQATMPVPDGFALTFIHSINLSPVDEYFYVDSGGTIVMDRMVYNQMSTGMPSGDEDGFAIENGRFVVRPQRHLAELAIRVSPVPGHAFVTNGKRRELTRWGSPGALLIIKGVLP